MIDALAAVAALGLGSSAGFPEAVLPDDAFAELLATCRTDRLSGLLARAVATGALPVDDAQHEQVAALDVDVQAQSVRVECDLLELADAFAIAGLDLRVLKGPGFAHRFWGDPALRPFVDLDLLVRGDELEDAVGVLVGLGAKRRLPQLRRGFDRRFAKGVELVGPAGVEWDLHRTVALGPLSFLVDVDDLWAGNDGCEVAGRSIAMPTVEACLVHACLHASSTGIQRLTTLRDVVEIGAIADLEVAAAMARRWSATAVVVDAVTAAVTRLRLTDHPLAAWAAGLHPTRQEQSLLALYVDTGASDTRLALAAWRHVPGLWRKVAYAAALVMPDATNRQARGRTRTAHLQGLLRGIR